MTRPHSSGSRPVADAPVAHLIARADELAKQWLIEIIEAGGLIAAATLPISQMAADAPALCAAAARALRDDEALRALESGGEHHGLAVAAASMSGASSPAAIANAVQLLRRVIWSEICAALERPGAEQVADLAERLAAVCAVVLAGALSLEDLVPEARERAETGPLLRVLDTRASAGGELPWILALRRRLAWDGAHTDLPGEEIAVLLVDVDGADLLTVANASAEVLSALESVERAVTGELRPADVLVREGPGRYWIVAARTPRHTADELARAIECAVRAAASHRGVPLTVSIGVAIGRAGADSAEDLVDTAEREMFGARSWGGSPPEGAPA